jgi:Fic family protein
MNDGIGMSKTDVFEELFGSKEKARLIRFFLLNDRAALSVSEIANVAKLRLPETRKALRSLLKIEMLRERTKNRRKVYSLNPSFAYLSQLSNLISASNTLQQCRNLSRLRRSAAVKYAAVNGLFTENAKSAVDLLIVVNDIRRVNIRKIVEYIEAEVGKEVRYSLLDIDEFRYRMEMLDRFLKDFFDGKHEEIVSKLPGMSRTIQSLQKQ